MNIAVTGSRNWTDRQLLWDILNSRSVTHLHVGDCPTGADSMALDWARSSNVKRTIHEANWADFGRKAGPMRNRAMIDSEPQLLIAFKWGDESRGTDDCIKAARNGFVPVLLIQHLGSEA